MCYRQRHIHHAEQGKHERLHQGDKGPQHVENDRDDNFSEVSKNL